MGKNVNKEKNEKRMNRRKGGGRKLSRLFDCLLILLILFCGLSAGRAMWQDRQQKLREAEIRRLAEQQEAQQREEERERERSAVQMEAEREQETQPVYESPIDFDALREVNPDTVAWIRIPGTDIDYPVVQANDNEIYLKTDFEGNHSSAGAIFADCDSDEDMLGFHTLLYGHHMKNGSMFAQLEKFKDETFFKEHREIILYLPDQELHLRAIAAVYGDDDGEKRRTAFDSQEMFDQYIDNMTKACRFRELPPAGSRGLYSLVTCSYEFDNARTIVYAVRGEELGEFDENTGKY